MIELILVFGLVVSVTFAPFVFSFIYGFKSRKIDQAQLWTWFKINIVLTLLLRVVSLFLFEFPNTQGDVVGSLVTGILFFTLLFCWPILYLGFFARRILGRIGIVRGVQ